MNSNQNLINEEIRRIKDEIHSLKEYLLSDCCRQCAEIITKIEKYESEIRTLETQLNSNECY